MKKLFSLLMALALAFGVFAGVAKADSPAPGGPFASTFAIQNLEGTVAQCSYEFINASGVTVLTSAITNINPGAKLEVYVPSLTTLNAGSYSAVVNCDKKVAAVVNFSDPDSGASHGGISDPGMVWYAPALYDDYYDYYSNIYVQNASSAPVNVTVEIFAPGQATAVKTMTASNVPAGATTVFEQEGATELNANISYSAKISGTGNIAPIVNIYGRAGVAQQLYSYNAVKSGSTMAYAPIIMHGFYDFNTSLTIQNMGTSTASVKVEYLDGTKAPASQVVFTATYNIAANSSQALYTPLYLPRARTILYSARVTSTNSQPIVTLVNQSGPLQRASSFNGFASGSTEARVPIVYKAFYGYNTSVNCQNVGTAATNITIAYAGVAGTNTTSTQVQPGASYMFYQGADPLLSSVPLNWTSAATITASQPIVCVVNTDRNMAPYNTQVRDEHYAVNAVNP